MPRREKRGWGGPIPEALADPENPTPTPSHVGHSIEADVPALAPPDPVLGVTQLRAIDLPTRPDGTGPRTRLGNGSWLADPHGYRVLDALAAGAYLWEAYAYGGQVDPNGWWHDVPHGLLERWRMDPDFEARHRLAQQAGARYWADRARHEAERATPDTVGVARLRSEAFRWHAKATGPKDWGDKTDVTSGGEAVAAPVTIQYMVIAGVKLELR